MGEAEGPPKSLIEDSIKISFRSCCVNANVSTLRAREPTLPMS